jgi:hypothetical protein
MGLEVITQPQVFLAGISALGGINGNPPPFYTSFYTWTTSTSAPTNIFYLDNPNVALLNIPSSYIVSVGGVVQSPSQYTINPINRSVNFNVPVIDDTDISVTQIGTVAVSTSNLTGLTAINSFFQNITAIDSQFINSLFGNLTATNFTVLSSFVAVDVTQQTLSVDNANFDNLTTNNLAAQNTVTQNILSFGGSFGGDNLFDSLTSQNVAITNIVNINDVEFAGTTQNITTSATNTHLRVLVSNEPFYIRLFKETSPGGDHIRAVKTVQTGDGIETTFAVNGAVSTNSANYRVDLDGVLQEPGTNYNIVGTNIVFTIAPPVGTKIVIITT